METLIAAFLIVTGWASQYDPGVMQRTIAVRQSGRTAYDLHADLPTVDGYVAVPDCSLIGTLIEVRPLGADEWELFLVADCASRSDRQSATDSRSGWQWMTTQNILVEVDYETAVRWDTVGRGIKVEVVYEPK
jgi:hypothetical protein